MNDLVTRAALGHLANRQYPIALRPWDMADVVQPLRLGAQSAQNLAQPVARAMQGIRGIPYIGPLAGAVALGLSALPSSRGPTDAGEPRVYAPEIPAGPPAPMALSMQRSTGFAQSDQIPTDQMPIPVATMPHLVAQVPVPLIPRTSAPARPRALPAQVSDDPLGEVIAQAEMRQGVREGQNSGIDDATRARAYEMLRKLGLA